MVYFVRHGESEANARKMFAGQRDDSPLTAAGEEQARAAAADVQRQSLAIDRIIVSPLQRARQTAEIIAELIGFDSEKITIEPRITEFDMGALSGTPFRDVDSAEWKTVEGAEDMVEFHDRVMAAVHDAADLPGNTLMVSHAGVGRMIEASLRHTHPHLFYDLNGYPHGAVHALALEPSPA